MDYDKMYFPKTEMSQLVPTGYFSPETYAAYAESFDLSLLPTDSEPQFELNQCQSEFMSLDYIPTTIFNDNQQSMLMTTIKTEKIWSTNEEDLQQLTNNHNNLCNKTTDIITSTNTDSSSILLQQLQKQYQFYPSPLPSPPQYDFNHNITTTNNNNCSTAITTQLPPSPSPSIEQQSTATTPINFNTFSIKKEYLILPPSPPESNGAPSPFNEIKSEPDIDTENFIDINTLLEKSLINFDTTTSTTTATTTPTPITPIKSPITNNSNTTSIIKKSTIGNTGGGGVIIPQDHQLLREYLQDTTFQKKHNLKPLALESLIGGFSVRGDIEPVISLALEHAKRDAQATCANLQISLDPQQWTTTQVHAWIRSTIEQFKLSQIDNLENKFPENGANLLCLTEEEFVRRVPESGGTIHAQLEIWKLACCENFLTDMTSLPPPSTTNNWLSDCPQNMDITDDEDDDLPSSIITSSDDTIATNGNTTNSPSPTTITSPTIINNNLNNSAISSPTSSSTIISNTTQISSPSSSSITTTTITPTPAATTTITPKPPRTGGSHIHLWQFLKELLATPQLHGTAIRWLDRNKGVFKIEDSVRVAKLWGRRKNRPAMNYDKLSRSIRQYYKKGIMKKTERSQRLVYQFCHPYCL